jgi:hypothetical protein
MSKNLSEQSGCYFDARAAALGTRRNAASWANIRKDLPPLNVLSSGITGVLCAIYTIKLLVSGFNEEQAAQDLNNVSKIDFRYYNFEYKGCQAN